MMDEVLKVPLKRDLLFDYRFQNVQCRDNITIVERLSILVIKALSMFRNKWNHYTIISNEWCSSNKGSILRIYLLLIYPLGFNKCSHILVKTL